MAHSSSSEVTLDKLIALCKRRGFVYQSADIYGGINGVYDFGPLGVLLKQNIRQSWLTSIYKANDNIVLLEGALLGPERMWEASGHLHHFHDPMVDCLNCKKRYRADEIDLEKPCTHCGQKKWTEVRNFNMMFKTQLGAAQEHTSNAYLRPETAQAIFVNFKNVISTTRIKMPFGIAQIGKAFRNEINPKQFLFRMREFEQMELEWFCKSENADHYFDFWQQKRYDYYDYIGLDMNKIRLRAHEQDERAHYSTKTSDVEYHFPFGWKELEGIAYRGNFDLSQHAQFSGKDFSVHDEQTKTSYIPHVVECSVGADRLFLTILFDSYKEDTIDGESRVVLALSPRLAPFKAAFLPLTKKLSNSMHTIYSSLKNTFSISFDESGSIGKRYRRNDEIGTPVCFTYDFESVESNTVTVRNRDTTKQERISIDQIEPYISDLLK